MNPELYTVGPRYKDLGYKETPRYGATFGRLYRFAPMRH